MEGLVWLCFTVKIAFGELYQFASATIVRPLIDLLLLARVEPIVRSAKRFGGHIGAVRAHLDRT